MTDVTELEQRITAALERIGTGLGRLTEAQNAAPDAGDAVALQKMLDEERLTNAQLEQRVIAIKDKQETLVKTLEGEVSSLRGDLAAKNEDGERLKNVNLKLRENNQALRDANATGVGDASLINDGKDAELDALRASHASDRAELDSILVQLKPLVEGQDDARS